MSRAEFVIATAIILFVAFCLGWFANWLIGRFSRVAGADMGELDRMSQELHEAEETRDQAITYLQQREAELTNQLSQTRPSCALQWMVCAMPAKRPKNSGPGSNASKARPNLCPTLDR